jgi:hypothetical protein
MRRKVIVDFSEPVVIRRYPNETLAALDQAVLAAADIPAMLLQNRYGETASYGVGLVVRREHVTAALQLLDAGGSDPTEHGHS